MTAEGGIHDAALRMLARRALSRHELAGRLARKGFSPVAVSAELRRLGSSGLLDEAELARAVVQAGARRGLGQRSLTATLRRRRLPRELAEAALAGLDPEQRAAALAVAVRKGARRFPGFDRLLEMRRKMIRYLLARGFGMAEVGRALRERAGDPSESSEPLESPDPSDVS